MGEVAATQWTRDDGAYADGATKFWFPKQTIREEITINSGSSISGEVDFTYPIRYAVVVPSFTLSRLKGKSTGGAPYLIPIISRAQFTSLAKVRAYSATAVSPATETETFELIANVEGVDYDSTYLPT